MFEGVPRGRAHAAWEDLGKGLLTLHMAECWLRVREGA